jgi:hypothetical protein
VVAARPRRTRRWWPAAGAAALVAGAVVVILIVVLADGGGGPPRPAASVPDSLHATPPSASGDATAATPVPTATTSTTSTVPTARSTTAPPPEPADISRPIVAANKCETVYARDSVVHGITFFHRSISSNPVPIQIIGPPGGDPSGRFALVQRYFDDGRRSTGDEAVVAQDGTTFWVSTFDNGTGVVEWDVGDGSQGYLRSRGLDRDTLVQLAGSLAPRRADATLPGFDYRIGRETPVGLRILHEQMNADVHGTVALSECATVSNGYRYRISAIAGDPVFRFGGVLDRPAPLDVGVRDGTLVVINGLPDPAAPTVDDVVDAAPAAWLELLSRPVFPESPGPRTETIREGADVVVSLVPTDPRVAIGYLVLRLSTRQGVTYLEVDTTEAVLAPDAAFWHTETSIGNDGISTARIGGTLGYRIGDAPIRDPIEVTVSVIDGGGFVLQSTGVIVLVPQA